MKRTFRLAWKALHSAFFVGRIAGRRWRRRRLLWIIAIKGTWYRSRIDVDVARDIRLGKRVRVDLAPAGRSSLRIGEGCIIGDDVFVELHDGSAALGPNVTIGSRSVFRVSGILGLAGNNLLQHGCTVHCDERITMGTGTTAGEYVTIADSSHTFDGPEVWFVHNVSTGPVAIGDDVWLAAKATVCRNVTIGDRAVVAANSVVIGDVSPGCLVSGVPARMVRHSGGHTDDVGRRSMLHAQSDGAAPAQTGSPLLAEQVTSSP